MKNKKLLFSIFFLIFCISFSFGQQKQKMLRDTLDNALDFSDFLINHKGVLPIVMPITEPAIGFGGVLAAIRFLPKKDPIHRPDMVVAAAGITTNGTWLAGGGYIGYWKNDKIRYRGFLGYTEVNLQYYGFGGSRPFDFSMKSFFLLQQANFRIKESDFFIGGKYQLSKITIPLFDNGNLPIDPIDYDMVNSGVSLITEYDNLNNFLTPTEGFRVHLSYDQNLEALGSDKNWSKLNSFTHMYFKPKSNWIAAFRLDSQLAFGNIPFYAKPYVSLRGVPALRYQGEWTMVAETEQTYNITSRWGMVGFTGIGTAFDTIENMDSDEIVWNVGLGTRYLIARIYGMKMGVDVARGPEDWAFYITVGTSWLR